MDPIDPDELAGQLAAWPAAAARWVHCGLVPASDPGRLWAPLAAVLDRWREAGLLGRWWFLWKPPGLRLRLEAQSDELAVQVSGWLDGAVEEGVIGDWAHGAYEPETVRFGGWAGLDVAHDQFDADAGLALRYELAVAAGRAVPSRGLWSLIAVNDLAVRLVDDRAELWDLWKRLDDVVRPNARGVKAAGYSESEVSAALLFAPSFVAGLDDTGTGLLMDLQRASGQVAGRFRAALAGGELTIGPRAWLAAITIFHWNRLGFTAADILPMIDGALAQLGGPVRE